ncbi:MAG: MFS transporter [Bauldia sp.]|nr:MFS transporter [Bauldia sp.]
MLAASATTAAPPHYALRMWLFFAGYFVFAGVSVPFFPVWLDARGLTDVQIATIIAVPGILRVVLTPFAGIFADRAPNRRFAVICFMVPAALVFLLAGWAESFLPILLVTAFSFTFWGLALPVGEALALTGMRRFGLDYGRMRIGGSVSFILTNLGAGAVVAVLHSQAVFWMLIAAMGVTVAVAFGLPVTPRAIRALDDQARPAPPSFRDVLREPAFLTLILIGGLIQSSHAMLYSFGSLFWRDQGFSGFQIGTFWATAVACEIVFFMVSSRLAGRWAPYGFFVIGAVAAFIRWLCFPLEPGFVGYLALQGLHAFSFGAVYLANQHAIARVVPDEVIASAQGVLAMVMGLLMALSTLAAGPLYAHFGGNAFALMAIMPVIALVVLFAFTRMRRVRMVV